MQASKEENADIICQQKRKFIEKSWLNRKTTYNLAKAVVYTFPVRSLFNTENSDTYSAVVQQ